MKGLVLTQRSYRLIFQLFLAVTVITGCSIFIYDPGYLRILLTNKGGLAMAAFTLITLMINILLMALSFLDVSQYSSTKSYRLVQIFALPFAGLALLLTLAIITQGPIILAFVEAAPASFGLLFYLPLIGGISLDLQTQMFIMFTILDIIALASLIFIIILVLTTIKEDMF